MKKLLALLLLVCGPAWAQNPTCPTRPPGDSTNACASTAFVHQSLTGGGFINYYPTHAAAIAATVPVNVQQLYLGGYYTQGDNGEATYLRLSAPPSPVKAWHFQSADGAWWQLIANPVFPKQLGATLDGTTDDTTAIQAWVDYGAAFSVVSLGQLGVALIPSASINLAAGASVSGARILTLRRGLNYDNSLLKCRSANNITIQDTIFDTLTGFASTSSATIGTGTTFNMTATPANVANLGSIAQVQITSVADPINYMIANINSYNSGTGVLNLTTVASSGSGTFANWYMDIYPAGGTLGDGNYPIGAIACSQLTVSGNHVSGRFYNGMDARNGNDIIFSQNSVTTVVNRSIHLAAFTGSVDGARIIDNYIDGNTYSQYGINTSAVDSAVMTNVVISGNNIKGTDFQGIEVGGAMNGVTVTNNTVLMRVGAPLTGVGILVETVVGDDLVVNHPENVAVSANNIRGGDVGIFFVDVLYSTITGNTVAQAGTGISLVGLQVSTPSNAFNTVSGNMVRHSAAVGINVSASNASGSQGIAIVGNTSTANGTYGVLVDAQSINGTVVGNVATGNTTANYSIIGAGNVSSGNYP